MLLVICIILTFNIRTQDVPGQDRGRFNGSLLLDKDADQQRGAVDESVQVRPHQPQVGIGLHRVTVHRTRSRSLILVPDR